MWHRSSFSNGAGGECVECASNRKGVLVRDSKRDEGPIIAISNAAWDPFIDALTHTQSPC
ncbi:DUF397 domain-containing protein [Streptomyces sp. NPDC056660]|uniref:DUF397 domain-containing protein n=1 Tax=Streptomyces sp. NPDC056660 TaxID=3345897 RepID=UPI0036CD6842